MAGNIDGTTVFSNISLSGSGATLTAKAVVATTLSATSFTVAGLSVATLSAGTLAVDSGLAVVFRASGVSLIFKSGSSIYLIGGSATSGAA